MSINFEKRGSIAVITINRIEALNAMDPQTYRELSTAWVEVRDNPDIWVAIITGAGDKSFTVGADLKKTIPMEEEHWEFWKTQNNQLLNSGLEVWKPVIAAVNGYCLGGGMTLLLATDIRIASENATFGLSEVKRGLLPGNGGTQRTLRQLPYPIAMELLLTGDSINAEDALRFGLINKVVPQDELMDTAMNYAFRICENGPLAVRAIKELSIRSQYMHFQDGLRMETAMQKILKQTDDAIEGPLAFAEKRQANFKGK
ncbi:enoyl-CoA hydratase/isomerase family protein [Cytobacillus depressus]|uniref:Enoyl-CoA hydratase/isomerase family protein n=1 Tax=Cytobacillus depressus TaxID=1602942 RepID=A0A6L3V580_9BACI|nr:enoyl-CoA hydratase-related protein [Cytobacillus depressus]KAB2336213.1 enoyl-CoA hydratase/isomerase family protein [Cytobacillus depressus]